MTTTVVKYYACTQFDDAGQCVTAVWIDQPTVIPPLSFEDGGAIGMQMFIGIVGVYVVRKLMGAAL
ncbi:hypothetical protein [Dyella sp. 2RAB6]|uniref:hypothetical protein n=1 Tax=Dyella sp. 2RAB6 TaxID=3232992 RepID=UPI003F903DBD